MATFTAIKNAKQSRGALLGVLKYVTQEKKTLWNDTWLVTGSDCLPQSSYAEMLATKQRFRKTDGRQFYHFVQSFSADDLLTPQQANAIGLEFAAHEFPDFEVIVATHIDTGHLHNHFVVNSVSHKTGRKLHQNAADLQSHRQANDEICMQHGLTVLKKAKKGVGFMPKKRANGEGNIRKRKDGRWEGRYTAGRNAQGKPIYKNVLGRTQAEVKEKLAKAIEESKGLDISKSGQYTVGQWMNVWFENYAKIKVRSSSHATYKGYIENHIKPNIGSISLDKLTTLQVQELYKKLLSCGRVERTESANQPKGLSVKTVRNIHQVLSSALDFAKSQKLIAVNPTEGCALPKLEHKEMKTLTADQLAAFLQEAKRSGVYEMYYLELATGLRRGELLGLKWEDVDLESATIHVRRQIARINGKVVEAPLKTKNSYRTLSIGADAVEILTEQTRKTNSDYVFPSPTGGPISPDSVLNMLHRVLKRAGLPKVRFHDLRHTFATLALQNGVDVKTVSGMLGHYSAGFTLDTYAHVTTQAQREAANTMENLLSSSL